MGDIFKNSKRDKAESERRRGKTNKEALKGGATLWGHAAPSYVRYLSRPGNYHERLIIPNLLRLLAVREGECILDIGCGEGTVSRSIAGAGARVIGIDESAELLRIAKKAGGDKVIYYKAEAHEIGALVKNGSCDAAVIVLALENIERYRETLLSCARALRSTGRLILVLNHPAFRIPKRSSWQLEQDKHVMYRRVDGYLSESVERIDMEPQKKGGRFVLAYHRPLQLYAKALERAGFCIVRVEEWTSHRRSVGARAEEENRVRREFPLFLAVRALKLDAKKHG